MINLRKKKLRNFHLYKSIKTYINFLLMIGEGFFTDKLGTFKELIFLLSFKKFSRIDILLLLDDDDYGLNFKTKKESQLIDALAKDLEIFDKKLFILRFWKSKLSIDYLKNKALSNRLLFLTQFFISIFKFKSFSKAHINGWEKTINLFKPKLIISIQPDSFLCKAAKNLNIPIFDLQHGIIQINKDPYYDFLKNNLKTSQSPTGILTIFKTTQNWLLDNNSDNFEKKYLGSPYLANSRHLRNVQKESNNQKVILISHQWPIKQYLEEIDGRWNEAGLSEELLKTISKISLPLKWIIRLHPLTKDNENLISLLKEIKTNSNSSIEIIKANTTPLPEHLINADLHITAFSAVALEASEYGIKSAVLLESRNLNELYGSNANKLITKIQNEEKYITSWIKNELSNNTIRKKFRLELYRKEYLENLENFLINIK